MLTVISELEGNRISQVDFKIGSAVKHKLYHYYGTVIAYDTLCAAGDKWYLANTTQPGREQPWYHVLVNQSGCLTTYVAQSNLEPDVGIPAGDHFQIS
ncbi:MAG: heat shock protein HspQ [Opitutae bacterium]|nr:heat shock protein HspQ [Opitutae bacterium]MDG1300177.1 heat shock protein HspQ [Opitutae bacterium]